MTEVLLFHHAHGRTAGVEAFADQIRAAGHTVHVPDLYEGRVFSDLDEGVGHAQQIGFETVIERGVRSANGLPEQLVYAGFSLGVLPAQTLAQSRQGAAGALLFNACVSPADLGSPWPADVPVQIHGMDGDEFFAEEGDLDAANELVASVDGAELFVYTGAEHLFADNSLASYDAAAARLLLERSIGFLNALS